MVRFEHLVSLLSRTLEDDDHEAAHQEGPVHHLLRLLGSAIVEHLIFGVIFVPEESGELPRVSVYHCQIKWPEIFVKRHVSQIIVDVEEESLLEVLRWLIIRYPKEFI